VIASACQISVKFVSPKKRYADDFALGIATLILVAHATGNPNTKSHLLFAADARLSVKGQGHLPYTTIGVGEGGRDRGIGPPLLGLGDNPPTFSDALVTCSCLAISTIGAAERKS